jgi:hypothetical protein
MAVATIYGRGVGLVISSCIFNGNSVDIRSDCDFGLHFHRERGGFERFMLFHFGKSIFDRDSDAFAHSL